MTDTTPPPSAPSFPAPAGQARLLLTTAPPDIAQDLAHTLVEERLAACVSLLPGVRSVYRWKGEIHDDPETQLLIKTTANHLPTLAARIQALHPHEVPELLILEPTGGSAAWLDWLQAQILGDAGER